MRLPVAAASLLVTAAVVVAASASLDASLDGTAAAVGVKSASAESSLSALGLSSEKAGEATFTAGSTQQDGGGSSGQHRRRLYDGPTASVLTEFTPLSCNALDLSCPPGTKPRPFSDAIAASNGGQVLIPCNECFEVDLCPGDETVGCTPSELTLAGGLNIEGRLAIPANAKLALTTPHIFVQGEFVASDTNEVNANNTSLQIIMTGSDNQYFKPHISQADKCPGGFDGPGCNVGTKAIVVAGGKLNIHGYSQPNGSDGKECPSWLNLLDVDAPSPDLSSLSTPEDSLYLTPVDPIELHDRRLGEEVEVTNTGTQRRLEHCPATLIDESFSVDHCDSPDSSCSLDTPLKDGYAGWKGGWGSVTTLNSSGTLLVSNRTIGSGSMTQGPEYDLGKYRGCLVENQKYLFSAKVRLWKDDGSSSICGSMNSTTGATWEHCPHLRSWAANEKNHDRSRTKLYIYPQQAKPDGEWMTLEGLVDFNELYSYDETPATSIYDLLKIRIKEEGVNIELDDVYFGLPPTNDSPSSPINVFPDLSSPSVCNDLVVGDGSAENARFAFPFYNNKRWGANSLTIEEEIKIADGEPNKFYRLGHRHSHGASLNFEMVPGCITYGSLYTFSGKFRLHQDALLTDAYIEIRVTTESGDEKWIWLTDKGDFTLGGDSGDADGWTTVQFGVTFTEEFASYKSYEFWLRTYNAAKTYNDLAGRDLYSVLDFDDLSFKRVHGPIRGLVVPPTIDGCWGAGSKVLVTSHTTSSSDQQVRTITGIETRTDGNRNVVLDEAIFNPPTVASEPNAPAEVALLSRNIKFDVDVVDKGVYNGVQKDDMPQGGHLMVLNTPAVDQMLSGVEIRRFGQMGKAWRHPINFHMSRSVAGSVIKNNVIRESYYKCIVIQGTDDLMVKANVAYDTRGHCYVLQDGAETGNTFQGNLGAMTKRINKDYRPLSGESDHDPATFLISNTLNSWVGNVAAGSIEEGYWFELRRKVRGLSKERLEADGLPNKDRALQMQDITLFEDNVAHSNGITGLRTHPDQWRPETEQVFKGFKTYRNAYGVYFYYTRNVALEGLYASDNYKKNVDLNRADNIRISNANIIGFSEHYKLQVASQDLWHRCKDSSSNTLVGVEFNYFQETIALYTPGTKLDDVRFSGFADTGCTRSAAMNVDVNERRGIGNTWSEFTQLNNINVTDNSPVFDGMTAKAALLNDVVLNDLDGSLNPDETASPATGVLVSNEEHMTKLATGACTEYPNWGYAYCANTCYRTVHFLTDIFNTEDIKLVATDNNDPSKTVAFGGNMQMDWGWYEQEDGSWQMSLNQWNNNHDYKNRVFSASLPTPTSGPNAGYTLNFVDVNGETIWPSYARKILEPAPDCGSTWLDEDITLEPPVITADDCQDFIRNGDVGTNFTHWMHTSGGAFFAEGAGVDGSNAIASISRWSHWQQISQYLDSRCVKAFVGRELEFKAYFRLEQKIDGVWTNYICDPDSHDYEKGCPRVKMYMKQYDSTQGDQDKRLERDYPSIGAVRPLEAEGEYSLIHGVFTIDQQMSEYDTFFISIGRTKATSRIFLDNISLKPLQADSILRSTSSQSIILNGDFEGSDKTMYWNGRDQRAAIKLVSTTGLAGEQTTSLESYNRYNKYYGPSQFLSANDFIEGQEYEVSFQYKLTDPATGNSIICTPGLGTDTYTECPEAKIYADARPNGEDRVWQQIGKVVSTGSLDNPWGVVHGTFKPSVHVVNAYLLYFYVEFMHKDLVITIDNVSMKPYHFGCDTTIVQNGDFEQGHNAFWKKNWEARLAKFAMTSGYGDSSKYALKMYERDNSDAGVYQLIHKDCLAGGDKFAVSAKVKMLKDDQTWFCDADSMNSCPVAHATNHGVIASVVGEPDSDGWYDVSGLFQMYRRDVMYKKDEENDGFQIKFYKAPAGVDLIIDNVVVSKIA